MKQQEPLLIPINNITIDPNAPIVFGEYTYPDTRRKFISKVYSIVCCMLVITSTYIGICNQNHQLQSFLKTDQALQILYTDFLLLFILTFVLCCCGRVFQESCIANWCILIVFTILETYMLGYVGVFYDTNTLLLGGIATVSITTGLSIYAIQTKYDYTILGNVLIVLFLGLLVFMLFTGFVNSPIINILYSTCGAIIFSFYIIYDTQLIVGGKHRMIQYTENDYVIAAIGLYIDIINLFLYILELLNGD